MDKDELENISALTAEANKEYSAVRDLGDLYVNLLRCSRSSDRHYRVLATESLRQFLETLALKPQIHAMELVDRASQRVGWQEEPSGEQDRALDRVCRAAITYMIEASGYMQGSLMTRRKNELVRKIDEFNRVRGKA